MLLSVVEIGWNRETPRPKGEGSFRSDGYHRPRRATLRECGRKGSKHITAYTAVANQAAIEFYAQNGMAALHTSVIRET